MALTITQSTIHPVDDWGALPIRFVTAKPAAADYPTGGYTLTPGQGIPLGAPIFGVLHVATAAGASAIGAVPDFDPVTGKLRMLGTGSAADAALAELAAGTDISALTFTLGIIGINP
jgi:hypothetical protein